MEEIPGLIRYAWLVPVFPLAGFILNGLLGWKLGKRFVSLVGCGVVFLSFLLSAGIFYQVWNLAPEARMTIPDVVKYTWMACGDFGLLAHTG